MTNVFTIKTVDDAFKVLDQKIDELKKRSDDVMPQPMKIERIDYDGNNFKINYGNDVILLNGFDSYRDPYRVKITLDLIDKRRQWFEEVCQVQINHIHKMAEQNEAAIENNKVIHSRIKCMMKSIGVPDIQTSWEYPSSRHKNKKEVRKTSGYLEDIKKFVPVSDNRKEMLDRIEARKRSFFAYCDKQATEVRLKEEQERKEAEKKKMDKTLAYFCVKYNLDAESTFDDIIDAILSRNKYLCLAHYLEANRNDWTDGPDYAQTGLNCFECDYMVPEDEEIHQCIMDLIEDWDGDGRVFRDCEYNYGYLFDKVAKSDPEIFEDYSKILGYIE